MKKIYQQPDCEIIMWTAQEKLTFDGPGEGIDTGQLSESIEEW